MHKKSASRNVATTATAARTIGSSRSNHISQGDHRGFPHCYSQTNGGRLNRRGNNHNRQVWDRQDYGRDWDRQYCHCSNYHHNNRNNGRRPDDLRGNGRDEHRSHQNSHNVNDDRCGGHRGHAHQISEKRSRYNARGCSPRRSRNCGRSSSRSLSCSMIPSKIRSRSDSLSVY